MTHSTTSMAPENESVAPLFVQQYRTQDIANYRKTLRAVVEICNQVLSNHGISHATEFRLKEPASLENKIAKFERERGFVYQTIEDINKDIIDLAGVCILVHIPSTRKKASELLHDAFVVKKTVLHPKQGPIEGTYYWPGSYTATHIHASLKTEDLHDRGLQPTDAKPVEIQVSTTEQRGWANLEHAILYKPKEKPKLAQRHKLEIMRRMVDVSESIHQQIEEEQAYQAAKENRSLRSVDDVGCVLQKWLEEQHSAWFQGRTAGSCTSLFNFLKSRNMNTRGELRQILEASFGSDSEALYSRLASEYPADSLTLVIFIMDGLLLTDGGSDVDFVTGDHHQIHVYKLQAMMSTFVWLEKFFTPDLLWQRVFAAQNQESLRDSLVWLNSARLKLFFDGDQLEKHDIAILDYLWGWFECQKDRKIRFAFAISRNGMFKDRKESRKVIQQLIEGLMN
ncbi:RelA/SpoT [Penicillium cf. griseofulvum]|uniref:RelA/SpoT n=1 Tax=Penicillium cf. griseofulvum TaxID=2972120 RepID=A0A9W9N000_9EURO|nr:RelA/SpoT [Penicillium cf. griseofulvum]KAJ5421595.1 RelA/SpoT [Penicillium cf. griseofulvum]KAJ5424834.1 RelA/SpoT [Penicillium cf. griseofulvum]